MSLETGEVFNDESKKGFLVERTVPDSSIMVIVLL